MNHHDLQAPFALLPLHHLACLRAEGADTDAFLQGQLSSDLRRLTPERGQLSSYNSPKGRMLAVLNLRRRGAAVELELPRSLLEPIARRLRLFVLRARVTLAASEEGCLGLRGPGAVAQLARAGLPVPTEPLACGEQAGVLVQRRHGDTPRFSLHAPTAVLEGLRARHWPDAPELPEGAWAHDDVLAGVPIVLPATQDRFVPQMANLDRLGGIAFDKGCYTGQEIVARLHYLGQLKRRMFLCAGVGEPPQPGTDVMEAGAASAVGEIVQAAPQPQGGFVASVVLQLAHAASAGLQVAGGGALTRPLPYVYPGQAAAAADG